MITFEPNKEEFIKSYNELKSSRVVAEYYNTNKTTILNCADEIGHDNKSYRLLNESQVQEILDKYEEYTAIVLAGEYNVSESLITKIWRENGKKGKSKNKYKFNENYFEQIDTKDKAYFLGLIASDGCIYNRNKGKSQSWINLSLQENDFYILELFKKYLNFKKPLTFVKREGDKLKNVYLIQIVSDEMAKDLLKYNITERKTYTYTPLILQQYMSHFIRGYFDGDGSINFSELHRIHSYNIAVASAFENNLNIFKEYLLNIGIESYFSEDKRKYQSDYAFGGLILTNITTKYCFLKFIYQDCDDLCLKRKKDSADYFINTIEKGGNKRYEDAIKYYNSIVINNI